MQSFKNLVHERQRRTEEERDNVKNANKKFWDRALGCNIKRRHFSQYKKAEEVSIRYGKKEHPTGKKTPKKR